MYNTVFRFIFVRTFVNHLLFFFLLHNHSVLGVRLSHKIPHVKKYSKVVSILKRGEYFCEPLYRNSSTESAEYTVMLPQRSSTTAFSFFVIFHLFFIDVVAFTQTKQPAFVTEIPTPTTDVTPGAQVFLGVCDHCTQKCACFLLQLRYSGNLVHLILPVCVIK